jgi:hypothetical protein
MLFAMSSNAKRHNQKALDGFKSLILSNKLIKITIAGDKTREIKALKRLLGSYWKN